MARYGRYEQSPTQIKTERIPFVNRSPNSSRISPGGLADDTPPRAGMNEDQLKEIVLAFGNEELDMLLKQVADTIKDRIKEKRNPDKI